MQGRELDGENCICLSANVSLYLRHVTEVSYAHAQVQKDIYDAQNFNRQSAPIPCRGNNAPLNSRSDR